MKRLYMFLPVVLLLLLNNNLTAQLSECYATDNWTINTENTSGSIAISDSAIVITNDMDFSGTNLDEFACSADDGVVSICITVPSSGDITFDWNIEGGFFFNPLVERFGYCINGETTELSSVDPPPFGTSSGTETITVEAGDELCFVYASKFGDSFASPVTINNFTLPECPPPPPLSDCYASENWTISTDNTNGSVTIDGESIVLVNDTDFGGNMLDEMVCAADDGMVTACITIPSTGEISFDWAVPGGPLFSPLTERFGYCLDGAPVELTSVNPPPFGTTSGSETISVEAGGELCFVYSAKWGQSFAFPVTVNNFVLPDCPPPTFSDCYDTANWTVNTENTSGSVVLDGESIVMTNDMDFSGTNLDEFVCSADDGVVSVCFTAPSSGDITFDWNIEGGFFFNPLVERFGYCINGETTELSSVDPPPFGTSSGTQTITVEAGDELCFVYASKFGDSFPSPVTINNFSFPECPPPPPLSDCYAAENWTITTNNTNGSVTIDGTSIVLVNDTDFGGNMLDELVCAADDGMVTACITVPATGEISFDWAVPGGPLFSPLTERFGYCLDGVPTELTSINPPPFGTTSGSETISVEAGAELCFVYSAKWGQSFAFPVTVNNFVLPACPTPPLTDCFEASNWTVNTENTSGSVTIDEETIVLTNDMDFGGTNLDEFVCSGDDGVVSVCITAPSYGDITFDWSIEGGLFFNPLVERFGYCLNGVSTELSSVNPPPFGTTSGTEAITVEAGDELCFVFASKFGDGFPFPVTINNISVPACDAVAPLTLGLEITETIACNGDDTGAVMATVTGGNGDYSYEWDNTGTDNAISNLTAGTYCVTVTDAVGDSITSCIEISEPDPISFDATVINDVSCFGDTDGQATVSGITGGTEDYSILWSNDVTDSTVENLSAGNYSVTITDANGCEASSEVSITEPAELAINLTSSPENDSNMDGAASVSVEGGTTPYTYSWNTDPVQTTDSISNLVTGDYEVVVTDDNGCEISGIITVDNIVSAFELQNDISLKLFPNPASEFIYILM